MDGNDGFGPWSDGALEFFRIDVEVLADIDQYRSCTGVNNRRNCCHERMAYGYHFVARTDSSSEQRKIKRVITTIDSDRIFDPNEIGKMLLEITQLLAEHQVALRQSVGD